MGHQLHRCNCGILNAARPGGSPTGWGGGSGLGIGTGFGGSSTGAGRSGSRGGRGGTPGGGCGIGPWALLMAFVILSPDNSWVGKPAIMRSDPDEKQAAVDLYSLRNKTTGVSPKAGNILSLARRDYRMKRGRGGRSRFPQSQDAGMLAAPALSTRCSPSQRGRHGRPVGACLLLVKPRRGFCLFAL
jgi:hypothetical protein